MALSWTRSGLAAGLLALAVSAASAGPVAPPGAASAEPAGLFRVADRLEMRSYQPYAGLQFGFRPTPPARRDVPAPLVVQPQRVGPVVGPDGRIDGPRYVYCGPSYQDLQPVTGPASNRARTRCR